MFACWLAKELAAGWKMVIACWLDNESVAGWTTVPQYRWLSLAFWCNAVTVVVRRAVLALLRDVELAARRTMVLSCWHDDKSAAMWMVVLAGGTASQRRGRCWCLGIVGRPSLACAMVALAGRMTVPRYCWPSLALWR